MSSAGIGPSQRHLREIDTRIYVHFLVTIVIASVKRNIKSFEFQDGRKQDIWRIVQLERNWTHVF